MDAIRPTGAPRVIAALMLREMGTSHGRSALGFAWAVAEPVAGILLLTAIFSLAFEAPPLGLSFAIFYASGLLPFLAYLDVSQKVGTALRFSRPLLFYPRVAPLDALLARFILNGMVQIVVAALVLAVLWATIRPGVTPDLLRLCLAYLLALCLALGVGVFNAGLVAILPGWERAWAVLTRPLFLLSGIFYLFEGVPQPYRDWLWWNPLIHIVGQMRAALFPPYVADSAGLGYAGGVALGLTAAGLILLRRVGRDGIA